MHFFSNSRIDLIQKVASKSLKKNIYECISKAVKYIDTQNQDGS